VSWSDAARQAAMLARMFAVRQQRVISDARMPRGKPAVDNGYRQLTYFLTPRRVIPGVRTPRGPK